MSRADLPHSTACALVPARALLRASPATRRRSIVVEACAGAGKTWMLVSRILRALLAGARAAADRGHHLHPQGGGRDALSGWLEWLAEFAAPSEPKRSQIAALSPARHEPEAQAAPCGRSPGHLAAMTLLRAAVRSRCAPFHGWFSQLLRMRRLWPSWPGLGLSAELQAHRGRGRADARADGAAFMLPCWPTRRAGRLPGPDADPWPLQPARVAAGRLCQARGSCAWPKTPACSKAACPAAQDLLGTTPEAYFDHLREPLMQLRPAPSAPPKARSDRAGRGDGAANRPRASGGPALAALFTLKGRAAQAGCGPPETCTNSAEEALAPARSHRPAGGG